MNDIFHISKLIIKKKIKGLSDDEKLQLKQFKKEFPFIKEVKIEELIGEFDSYSAIDKENAWNNIKKKHKQRKEKPVFKLLAKSWYKFAAAVLIGVFVATYYFKNNVFNTPIKTPPVIVNTNSVNPGTDKATLTLANGKQVPLEKGASFQTSNAKSNGEQIFYQADNKTPKELSYNYLTIPRGGQFKLTLSDGTKVWLNSESQLKYPVSFIEGKTRKVELIYGEAYFDVTSSIQNNGSKFIVWSKSQDVEVLGTEFNIKAYKNETNIYTTLVEGNVTVGYNNKKQNLSPNMQSTLNLLNHTVSVAEVDVESEISWKEGVFSFKGKTLRDIMMVISRWYDVDVNFKNKKLEEITFKGVLGKNQNLEEILTTIQTLSIIKNYQINGKTITIE